MITLENSYFGFLRALQEKPSGPAVYHPFYQFALKTFLLKLQFETIP